VESLDFELEDDFDDDARDPLDFCWAVEAGFEAGGVPVFDISVDASSSSLSGSAISAVEDFFFFNAMLPSVPVSPKKSW